MPWGKKTTPKWFLTITNPHNPTGVQGVQGVQRTKQILTAYVSLLTSVRSPEENCEKIPTNLPSVKLTASWLEYPQTSIGNTSTHFRVRFPSSYGRVNSKCFNSAAGWLLMQGMFLLAWQLGSLQIQRLSDGEPCTPRREEIWKSPDMTVNSMPLLKMTHVLHKNVDVGYLNAKPPLNVRFLTPNLFLSTNFMLRIPYHLCFFEAQDMSFAWTPAGWVKTRLIFHLKKKRRRAQKSPKTAAVEISNWKNLYPRLYPCLKFIMFFNDVKFMSHLEIHPIAYTSTDRKIAWNDRKLEDFFSEEINPIIILMASWPAPFDRPISWIILSFSLMAASSSAWNFSNKHTALIEIHQPGICLGQSWNGNKRQLCVFEIIFIWSSHFVEFCSRTLFWWGFWKNSGREIHTKESTRFNVKTTQGEAPLRLVSPSFFFSRSPSHAAHFEKKRKTKKKPLILGISLIGSRESLPIFEGASNHPPPTQKKKSSICFAFFSKGFQMSTLSKIG